MAEEVFPKLALGTWLMGGGKDPDPDNDDNQDISVIRLAIDNGIQLIDTAQNYAAGKCEAIIGQAVATYSRDRYQILTKQRKENLSYDDVIRGCHESLKNLNLEYIDYFVCHAPNTSFDMRDFFRAANKLHREGLIRNIGVSNFGPKLLQLALDSCVLPIALNQVSFSLSDDDVLTTGTYDFCLKNHIPIQAYRTLVNIGQNLEVNSVLTDIAEMYDLTIQQVVIAYLNSYEGLAFTIRASSELHWQEIKNALDVKLSQDDLNKLYQLHKNKQGAYREFLLQ